MTKSVFLEEKTDDKWRIRGSLRMRRNSREALTTILKWNPCHEVANIGKRREEAFERYFRDRTKTQQP